MLGVHTRAMPLGVRRQCQPQQLELEAVVSLRCGCWKPNPGLLQELLATQPTLSSLFSSSFFSFLHPFFFLPFLNCFLSLFLCFWDNVSLASQASLEYLMNPLASASLTTRITDVHNHARQEFYSATISVCEWEIRSILFHLRMYWNVTLLHTEFWFNGSLMVGKWQATSCDLHRLLMRNLLWLFLSSAFKTVPFFLGFHFFCNVCAHEFLWVTPCR